MLPKTQKNNCYFRTSTKPIIGDIVQTCRFGRGVIISLMDDDTAFTFINTNTGEIICGNLTSDSDLIERPKQLAEVIFRRFKRENKEVIALFPAIAADLNVNNCLSYQNCGQHGAASSSLIGATIPAHLGEEDVNDLFIELTRRGYFLKVITRFSNKHKIERQKQIV
jgi:hypothetical protein